MVKKTFINIKSNIGWNFDNSYSRLPESFYSRLNPTPTSAPNIVISNDELAESLGLNNESLEASLLSGNEIPAGSDPIAQAYAGHQFGNLAMLGDGRAILLGEQITPENKRFDIQLKGSGPTPFSRNGDGRAALGPMLREYIISEAFYALGIPTTRSLAVTTTGDEILRKSLTTNGAVLTRVAASHIRVGTFEYAARSDPKNIKIIADYTIKRHYPDLVSADNPYLALIYAMMEKQASLIAKWMSVGFIHGVMNSDNMTLSGETIDYGPCAFMDIYDPKTVFSSIDINGRYSYRNQPHISQWNIARFAETLLPLLDSDQKQAISKAEKAIKSFSAIFKKYWNEEMIAKIGLFSGEDEDIILIEKLLELMEKYQADFTNIFRSLSMKELPDNPFFHEEKFISWHKNWQIRLKNQPQTMEASRRLMISRNPNIIPRNYYVEEALEAATKDADFTVMKKLLAALEKPYVNSASHNDYINPPSLNKDYKTFCGT